MIINEIEQLIVVLSKRRKLSKDRQCIFQAVRNLKYVRPLFDAFHRVVNLDIVMEMCGKMTVEHFLKGTAIFREHDPTNNKLYIIIRGNVLLVRDRPLEQLQSTQKQEAIFYGYMFRELNVGDGFGDKAMLWGSTRSLTAMANTDVDVIVIHKEDLKAVEQTMINHIQQRNKLILSVFGEIRNDYSTARLDSMLYSFDTEYFLKDEFICNEDQHGDYFYIILQGDLLMSRKHTFNDFTEDVVITILAKGTLLCEEIALQPKYLYTVKVQSNDAILLRINRRDFQSRFPPEFKQSIQNMRATRWRERMDIFVQAVQRTQKQKNEIKEQLEKVASARLQEKMQIPRYSLYDTGPDFLRSFIKLRAGSQYLSSQRGERKSVFENPNIIIQNSQRQLKEPYKPISEQLDFGKGEVAEMNKRKQVQLCVMSKDKFNYLNQVSNPLLLKLKKNYLSGVKKYSCRSISQSISVPITPHIRSPQLSPKQQYL